MTDHDYNRICPECFLRYKSEKDTGYIELEACPEGTNPTCPPERAKEYKYH